MRLMPRFGAIEEVKHPSQYGGSVPMRWQAPLGFTLTIIAAAIFLMSCGGSSQPATVATVNVSLSDPATCAAPQGPLRHIYVTVTDVKMHQSDNASASDSGWLDLAPSLKDNPVQVDLLGVSNQCFLAMLDRCKSEQATFSRAASSWRTTA